MRCDAMWTGRWWKLSICDLQETGFACHRLNSMMINQWHVCVFMCIGTLMFWFNLYDKWLSSGCGRFRYALKEYTLYAEWSVCCSRNGQSAFDIDFDLWDESMNSLADGQCTLNLKTLINQHWFDLWTNFSLFFNPFIWNRLFFIQRHTNNKSFYMIFVSTFFFFKPKENKN